MKRKMLFCPQKRKSLRITVFSNKTIRHLFLIIIIVSVTIFFMTYNDLRVSQLSQPFQIRRRILADRTILQQYEDAVQQITEVPPLKEARELMNHIKSNTASGLDTSEKHLELIDRALSSKKRKHYSLNRSRPNKHQMESKQSVKVLEGSLVQISKNSNKQLLNAGKQPEDAEQTLHILDRLLTDLGDLNKTKHSYKPRRSIGKPHDQRAAQIENEIKNENVAHAEQSRKSNQSLKILKGFVPGDKAFNRAREIGDNYTTTATKTKDNINWQRYNKTAAGHASRLTEDGAYRIDTRKKLDNEEVIRNIRNYQLQKNVENGHNRQSYDKPHGNAKAVKANNTLYGSNLQQNKKVSGNEANANKMGNNSKRFHWPLKNNKLDDGSKRQNNSGQLDNKEALNGNTRNAFYKSIESNNSIVDTYNAQHNNRKTNQKRWFCCC